MRDSTTKERACSRGCRREIRSPDIPRDDVTGQQSCSTAAGFLKQSVFDEQVTELERLAKSASAGDSEALDELRDQLERLPHIWRMLSDAQRDIEVRLAKHLAGDDPLRVEACRKRFAELRTLIGPQDSEPLLEMTASGVVNAFMFCQLSETIASKHPHDKSCFSRLHMARRGLEVAIRSLKIAQDIVTIKSATT